MAENTALPTEEEVDRMKLGKLYWLLQDLALTEDETEEMEPEEARAELKKRIRDIRATAATARRCLGQATENLKESLQTYNAKRERLLTLCRRIGGYLPKLDKSTKNNLKVQFGCAAEDILTEVQAQLHKKECPVLVAGETSSGKSTLLNRLLGEDILPVAHMSSTSTICELKYGENKQAVVHLHKSVWDRFLGQKTVTIPLDGTKERQEEMKSYMHLEGASRDSLPPAERVEIFWPLPLLQGGIVIVDSPGVGKSEMMDKVVADYIPRAFAFLYIIDSSRVGGVQQDRLGQLLKRCVAKENAEEFHPESAMFICNKWDLLPPKEQYWLKSDTFRKLSEMWPGLKESQMFYVSTKQAVGPGGILSEDFTKVLDGLDLLLLKSLDIKLETQHRLLQRLSSLAGYTEPHEEGVKGVVRNVRDQSVQTKDLPGLYGCTKAMLEPYHGNKAEDSLRVHGGPEKSRQMEPHAQHCHEDGTQTQSVQMLLERPNGKPVKVDLTIHVQEGDTLASESTNLKARNHPPNAPQPTSQAGPSGIRPARDSNTKGSGGKPVVLLVNDEYGTAHGDVSTVHRQMAAFLASKGAVTCSTVLGATKDDEDDAAADGVQLIFPTTFKRDERKATLHWLTWDHQTRYPNLPSDVSFIVGHVNVTSHAARQIREQQFPEAKLIQVTHEIPEETSHYQGDEKVMSIGEETDSILEDLQHADVIFSVGPYVYDYYKNQTRDVKPHMMFLPKPSDIFSTVQVKHVNTETKVVLSIGRVRGEERLKGYDLVTKSMVIVIEQLPNAKWRACGVSPEDFPESKKVIQDNVENGKFNFTPLKYGMQKELSKEMQRADIVVMPSRAEPFGLIGLEAIAAGVPLLVSNKSGLAWFLKSQDPEFDRLIVEITDDDHEAAKTLAKRIITVLKNGDREFQAARRLKEKLLASKYWEESHRKFVEAFGL